MEAIISRYPDFIICGAPKCGTTSLHFNLTQHTDIGIPKNEIFYFSSNDPVTHANFYTVNNGQIINFTSAPGMPNSLDNYQRQFAPLHDKKFIGEDSTSYSVSSIAAQQIHQTIPDAKLIFMLRDPVRRAYSQYWHQVTHGRATKIFEKELFKSPYILQGSCYLENLKRYYELFDKKQIKIILFEDYIADKQKVIDEVTDFLGAERFTIKEDHWSNKTSYPVWLRGQLLLNHIGKHVVKLRYQGHLQENKQTTWGWIKQKIHNQYFYRISPLLLKAEKPPPMQDSTKAFLETYFSQRNQGLSELLNRDLSKVWKNFKG